MQLDQLFQPVTSGPIHSRRKVQPSRYLKVRTPPQAWEAVLAGVRKGGPGLFQGDNTGSNTVGDAIFSRLVGAWCRRGKSPGVIGGGPFLGTLDRKSVV